MDLGFLFSGLLNKVIQFEFFHLHSFVYSHFKTKQVSY